MRCAAARLSACCSRRSMPKSSLRISGSGFCEKAAVRVVEESSDYVFRKEGPVLSGLITHSDPHVRKGDRGSDWLNVVLRSWREKLRSVILKANAIAMSRGHLRRLHYRRFRRVHVNSGFVVADPRNLLSGYVDFFPRVPMSRFDHDFTKHPTSSADQEVSHLADRSITCFDVVAFYNSCAAKM